jgi:hypothetical protein
MALFASVNRYLLCHVDAVYPVSDIKQAWSFVLELASKFKAQSHTQNDVISMGVGRLLDRKNLMQELKSLDLDEGIRMESRPEDKKIFVNRNVNGIFVIQVTDFDGRGKDDEISYHDSPSEVIKVAKRNFKGKFSAWQY